MHDNRPMVELDHNSPGFLAKRLDEYGRLRRECSVALNTSCGGSWLVTGYGVQAIARDNETCAQKFEPDAPDAIDYLGIAGIPRRGDRKVGMCIRAARPSTPLPWLAHQR